MLKLSKIYKSYSGGETRQEVLKGVSFIFPDKGFFSILGKSGSGKTTLLNIIGGIDTFDSGEIIIDNQDYSKLTGNDWCKIHTDVISFVFQEYNLLDQFTIIENLKFAIPDVKEKIIDDTLCKFDLIDIKNKYPNQLSGGEKQRIAIIRSLLKKSQIILVDEPTGNLDSETAVIVMDFLKQITKNKLVIMITHDKDIAEEYSDTVLQMKQGKLLGSKESDNISCTESLELNDMHSLPFPLRNAVKLAFKQMRKKLGKHIQYIIMFATTIFFMCLGFALLFVNEFSVAARNLIDTNTIYYDYVPIYIDNADEQNFFYGLESDVSKYYPTYSIYLEEYGEASGSNSYLSVINGYIEYYDDIDIIYGSTPVNDNEIAVSDYFAKALEMDMSDITSKDDVIEYIIPNTNIEISGIYETDYENYIDIFDLDENFLYDDSIDSTTKSIAQYKVMKVYSIAYTSPSFDYENTKDMLTGFLPDFSSDTTNASVYITSLENTDGIVYSSYNGNISNTNDIFISKDVLSIIIQRDFNYNINSNSEFNAYWEDHEQELVEYVLGKDISLSQTLRIKDITYPYGKMVIKGVYSNIDADNTSKTIQVSNLHYNKMFVSDYMFVINNTSTSELMHDMMLLHDKNYEFEGFNLSTIISFREDTRPVITNIALGISIILSLFSILLFTNLLSRDVTSMKSEIGLLRTLGIKMSSISKMYVIEIVTLGIISWIVAIAFHPLGLRILNYTFASGYKDLVIVSFNFKTLLYSFVAVVFIMIITAIVPFARLSRMKLIECIKRNY